MSAQTLREAIQSNAAFTKWCLEDIPGDIDGACHVLRRDILDLIEEERNQQITNRLTNRSQSEIDQERLDKFVCAALSGGSTADRAVREARVALKALGEG